MRRLYPNGRNLLANRKNIFLFIILPGILTWIAYLVFTLLEDGGKSISLYMIIYSVGFVLFLSAYFFIKRNENGEISFLKIKLPWLIIIFGLLFRLTLLPSATSTSEDVYRYVWEGKVLLNGFNPLTIPPNDPQLEHFRDNVYDKITFKHIPAIYPPLSQLMFAAVYFFSGNSLLGFKIVFLICEAVTLIFLLKLLVLKKYNPNFVILYAWLPLPVMEYFINTHLDPFGIMLMIISLYFIEKGNYLKSSVFLALSALARLYPAFLIPLIFRKIGFKKSLYFIITFSIVVIIFYLPFLSGDLTLFKALSSYLARWEFNGSVYNLLKSIFSDGEPARIICGICFLISILIISFRYKDFLKASFGIFLSLAIFSSTLYPWYLGWAAALNLFAGFYSILSLFFTINFSNVTPMGEVWQEYTWVLLLEYIPFFIFLGYDLFKLKKSG
jgi:alpha-1,6-mannosyltransferase